MKCENCKKEIKNKDTACYSKETNVYLCSLDCLTNYAHEYLSCVPITADNNDFKAHKSSPKVCPHPDCVDGWFKNKPQINPSHPIWNKRFENCPECNKEGKPS